MAEKTKTISKDATQTKDKTVANKTVADKTLSSKTKTIEKDATATKTFSKTSSTKSKTVDKKTLQVNIKAETTATKNKDFIEFDKKSATVKATSKPEAAKVEHKKIPKPKEEDWVPVDSLVAGRFEIVSRIGQGAFAQVFKAKDKALNDQLVAVKLIKLQNAKESTQATALNVEKEAFAKLSFSKHVVGLHAFDISDDKYFYMAIDLVENGQTLQQQFQQFQQVLSLEEFIYYYKQICEGLLEIHRANIVHRDIKPQNILVTPDENAVISDFGISKISNVINHNTNQTVGFEGTPRYAAPEQVIESSKYIKQSDIYSVGVMMYISLTGVEAHTTFASKPGERSEQIRLAKAHVYNDVVLPSVYNPNLPAAIDNIVMKCLAKDVKNRYQDFKDVIDDLDHIHENINDKHIQVVGKTNDKVLKKALKQSPMHKYQVLNNLFTWKFLVPFFTVVALLVIALVIVILAS